MRLLQRSAYTMLLLVLAATLFAAPAWAAAATNGTLAVTSAPSGANVSVDGILKGRTPVTLPGIIPGAHNIVFTIPKYQSLTKAVTVTAGKTTNVTGTLTLIPTTGKIAATSAPTGANIALDGVAKGKTPVTLAGIRPGAHNIVFTRAGYQSLKKSVTVTAGKTTTVTGTLAALGPISLRGVQSVTVSAARLTQGANMHHYDYTDSTGNVWGGIPLWYLVGFMDDTVGAPTGSHGSGTFNDAKAATGYTVTVTGKSGTSASFTSQAVAKSNAYLVANTLNGVPIASTDAKGPYKLVGTGVTAAKSINGIVTIKMV